MAACFSRFGSALSHGMCSETVGVARVSCWMTAQSSILSKMSRGSPGPGKRAKRVPPVPTPQDGTATCEGRDLVADGLDLDAAAVELLAERRVVALEVGLARGVVLLDDVGGDDCSVMQFLPASVGALVAVGTHGPVGIPRSWEARPHLPRKALRVAGVDVDDVAGRFRRHVGGEEIDRLGDVLGKTLTLQQRALAVVLLQLVRSSSCRRRRAARAIRRSRSSSRAARRRD